MAIDARLITYSTVRDTRLSFLIDDLVSPDTAPLHQIHDALDSAGRDYVGRRYSDAIADYRRAATLIAAWIAAGVLAATLA